MKKSIIAIAAALGLGLAGNALAGDKAAAPAAAKKEARMPLASLKWEKPFGPDGPEFAYVAGDAKTGPFQMFIRMAKGGAAGWHTHDADYTGVVVQGTWQHLVQGETKAMDLPAGSFWSQAKTENHDDRCVGPDTCIVYINSTGAQTFHAKLADGKDAPPPPAKDAKAAPPAAAPKK